MTTVDTDAIRRQLAALTAAAADDATLERDIALLGLAVANHVETVLGALDDARREANQYRQVASLAAETLAASEKRPHRHPVESARVLGIVRGIAANMPQEDAEDKPEPTPAKPALITPGARRWWSTPAIHPTNTAVR